MWKIITSEFSISAISSSSQIQGWIQAILVVIRTAIRQINSDCHTKASYLGREESSCLIMLHLIKIIKTFPEYNC